MNEPELMPDCNPMQALKARIRNGQVVLDKPLNLPEGHELEVHLSEPLISDEERALLHASILRGIEDGAQGREMDADEFLSQLAAEA
jgi:hypothetical protein